MPCIFFGVRHVYTARELSLVLRSRVPLELGNSNGASSYCTKTASKHGQLKCLITKITMAGHEAGFGGCDAKPKKGTLHH